MATKASDIFVEYESESYIYNWTLDELAGYDPERAWVYPVGVAWETVDDDGFLATWLFLEESYYNGLSDYDTNLSDSDVGFGNSRTERWAAIADGHSFTKWSWLGWGSDDDDTASTYVAMYFPQDGDNIEPPTFTANSLSEDSSNLTIALDSAESAALIGAYETETGLVSATISSNVKEKAAKISLLAIDVAHTFKKIPSVDLSSTLSAFESGETEATEAVSISTTKSGY